MINSQKLQQVNNSILTSLSMGPILGRQDAARRYGSYTHVPRSTMTQQINTTNLEVAFVHIFRRI